MKRPYSCLAPLLLVLGCRDASQTSAEPRPSEPGGRTASERSAGPVEPKGTSVMRASVVAETKPPPKPEPQQLARTVIQFDEGSAKLSEEARARIDRLLLKEVLTGRREIIIRGHSDTRGGDEDNAMVSRRRAEAVFEHLVGRGVAPERVTLIALGETRPVAPNARLDGTDFPEGRARNRRVAIEIESLAGPETPGN